MPAVSHRRTLRRAATIVAAAVQVVGAYACSFVSVGFLIGAGIMRGPMYQFLCDTLYAPLFLIDGDSGRIEWLFNMAADAYWLGFSAKQ